MNKTITLAHLKQGEKAVIETFEIENNFTLRLKDLGLVKGETVEVYIISPLGSPVCILSRSGKLLIRKQILKNIYVRVEK